MVGWDSMFLRSAIVCLGDFHTRQNLCEIPENLGVHRLECVSVCVYVAGNIRSCELKQACRVIKSKCEYVI